MPEDSEIDTGLPRGLGVFFAGYAKRLLEGRYDQLFETRAGIRLTQQSDKVRYGLEVLLNFLTAVMDQKIKGNTPLGHVIKEILTDAGPELSKRIINGSGKMKIRQAMSELNSQERIIVETLLDLDGKELATVLNWFTDTDPEQRSREIAFVAELRLEVLRKFAAITPVDREKIRQLFTQEREIAQKKAEATAATAVRHRLISGADRIRMARQRLGQIRRGH